MHRSISISLKLVLIAFLAALLFNLLTGKQATEPQQTKLSSSQ